MAQLEVYLQLRAKRMRRGPTTFTAALVRQRTLLVNVLGEVRTPGVHRVQPTALVLDLISRAGGPTPEAGWLVLVIKYEPPHAGDVPEQKQVLDLSRSIRLDLEQLMAGERVPPVPIANGDTIYVPKAGQYFVSGEVQRPGQYRLQRDTTVIKAVSRAGGFTRYASKKRLTVWRYPPPDAACRGDLCLPGITAHSLETPPQEYRVHLHDRLQPGDVLVIH